MAYIHQSDSRQPSIQSPAQGEVHIDILEDGDEAEAPLPNANPTAESTTTATADLRVDTRLALSSSPQPTVSFQTIHNNYNFTNPNQTNNNSSSTWQYTPHHYDGNNNNGQNSSSSSNTNNKRHHHQPQYHRSTNKSRSKIDEERPLEYQSQSGSSESESSNSPRSPPPPLSPPRGSFNNQRNSPILTPTTAMRTNSNISSNSTSSTTNSSNGGESDRGLRKVKSVTFHEQVEEQVFDEEEAPSVIESNQYHYHNGTSGQVDESGEYEDDQQRLLLSQSTEFSSQPISPTSNKLYPVSIMATSRYSDAPTVDDEIAMALHGTGSRLNKMVYHIIQMWPMSLRPGRNNSGSDQRHHQHTLVPTSEQFADGQRPHNGGGDEYRSTGSGSGSNNGNGSGSSSSNESRIQYGHDGTDSDDEEEEEDKRCRICLETEGDYDDIELDKLISPCLCKGSSRYIHLGCLKKWRAMSPRKESNFSCDTCHYSYSYSRPWLSHILGHPWFLHTITGLMFASLLLFNAAMGRLLDNSSTGWKRNWLGQEGPFSTVLGLDIWDVVFGFVATAMLGVVFLVVHALLFGCDFRGEQSDTERDSDDEDEESNRGCCSGGGCCGSGSHSSGGGLGGGGCYGCYCGDCAGSGGAAAGAEGMLILLLIIAVIAGTWGAFIGLYRLFSTINKRALAAMKETILEVK